MPWLTPVWLSAGRSSFSSAGISTETVQSNHYCGQHPACELLSGIGVVAAEHRSAANRSYAGGGPLHFLAQTAEDLSVGYDGVLADIYWTRAVQYFGDHLDRGAEHYDLLAPLLEITTALDPHLLVAYEYGSNFLAATGGQPQRAIQLVEFGIRNNPNEWHLYYDLGFIYYLEFKDYARASDSFVRGSRVPDAHPFLKVLAAEMAQRGGDIQTARMLWTTTYQTTKDRDIRGNAAAHWRALQANKER